MATETTTGATPGTDATSEQAGQGQPSAGATPGTASATEPATGEEALGNAGKAAIAREREARDAEKKRADAAEKELTKLREATQSEQEKVLTAAKRETADERDAFWQGRIRSAETRGALRSAGIGNEKLLSAIAAGSTFANLTVNDDGTVAELERAVEQARKDYPEAFASTTTVTRGPQTSIGSDDALLGPQDRLRRGYELSSTSKGS